MIEIVKPEWLVGNEKRFSDFISELNDKDRVALISHGADIDGIVSAKIIDSVINPDFIKFVGYTEINSELVEELRNAEVNKVIFSDIHLKEGDILKEIEKFAEILIIDHHIIFRDFNSSRIVFMSAKGLCASYLAYYLFSKVQNLERFDWLTAVACVADFTYQENSKWMYSVFKKYGDKFVIGQDNLIMPGGKFWQVYEDLALAIVYFQGDVIKVFNAIGEGFGNIGHLAGYAGAVREYMEESIERFERGRKEIKGRIFWEFAPRYKVGAMIATLVSSKAKYHSKTIIIGRNEGNVYSISARRQDGKEDMNVLLMNLTSGFQNADGGGHIKAAGGYVSLKDKAEFIKRLEKI
jgi:single-stranded DNA-specific DHH superfamily exonuclease